MSTLCLTARGPATAEARPDNNAIVVKVGDALISMDPADARQLGEDLMAAAATMVDAGIVGTVTATADHSNDAVVIMVDGRRLLDLSVSAWSALAMQGSSAALQLKGQTLRVGLRSANLLRRTSDLVEVTA